MTDDTEMQAEYRARSAELRGLAAAMSGATRNTILDMADHWETLAKQAETIVRSRKLIEEWERERRAVQAVQ